MPQPITYQQESCVTYKGDAINLLEQHWEEIALNKEVIHLNPDWDAYAELEDRGLLKIFTARSEGKLVGYFVVICRNHLHYKDHVFAFNDVLYLHKDYRKGFTGAKLMKFAEECLKHDGISVLVVNTKRHKPFDILLSWLGYKHVENVYTKLLRD
jgi:GNAT superfamily N-acetyltransferase